MTIISAAALLRAGHGSAADLLEASLAAVDAHNGRTNAFTQIDAAGARAAARAADLELQSGRDRGPLHGIPISIKDLIDQAGLVTTAASRVLRGRRASADAPVVSRLREAGVVILGRTNLHEFALGTTSEDSAFGPVRHPMDPARSAGGSSGGSAAAVATGMGLASIGTDTGGSIRIPAAVCGLVGLKPTFGEVPVDGVVPLSPSLDHVGPIALTVADATLLWAALTGRRITPVAARKAATVRLRPLEGYFAAPLDRQTATAYARGLDLLSRSGCQLLPGNGATAEIAGPVAATIAGVYVDVVLPEAASWHAAHLDARGDEYTPVVRARLEAGRQVPPARHAAALSARMALRRLVDAALEHADALVLPTLPIVAPLLGVSDIVIDPARPERTTVRAAMLRQTQLFNLTGHPAVSLPLPADGLPVGLQLVGRIDDTRGLVATAEAVERAMELP
jgi:aspartyl-tRNA(Asn)/glutamyl-tRNA(Gln) amidotransferase subunit A